MAHILANRVAETTLTSGAGDLILVASPGYRRFGDRMAIGDTCWYLEEQFSNGVPIAWELGLGTYKGNNVLGRTRVFESTNGTTKVAFDDSKKVVTMSVVAPSADTAADWVAALGISVDVDGQKTSLYSLITSISTLLRLQTNELRSN